MKPSSDRGAAQPPDKSSAWGWTLTNLVVLPGLGTIAAGQKKGYAQAAITIVGMVITLIGVSHLLSFFADLGNIDETALGPLLVTFVGLLITLIGWVWALITSLGLLKRAKEQTAASKRGEKPPVL